MEVRYFCLGLLSGVLVRGSGPALVDRLPRRSRAHTQIKKWERIVTVPITTYHLIGDLSGSGAIGIQVCVDLFNYRYD
jgi:hypothetical protein